MESVCLQEKRADDGFLSNSSTVETQTILLVDVLARTGCKKCTVRERNSVGIHAALGAWVRGEDSAVKVDRIFCSHRLGRRY